MILQDAFSSSEALGMGTSTSAAGDEAPTARFEPGEHAIVLTEDGRRVEPGSGESGRVAVGGVVPVGYYKDPEKSAATFIEFDGERYSMPGDWATVEADGTLTLLGRGSVCINSGGEKIFPEEVEEALKLHPAVVDAVAVGVPDDRFGEAVTAVVEPAPGESVDADALIDHVKERLARYKAPPPPPPEAGAHGGLHRPGPERQGRLPTLAGPRRTGGQRRPVASPAMADLGYDGKVAIITGAGGGLGREHALLLASRGAQVVVNDLGGSVDGEGDDAGPAQTVAGEIEDAGGVAVANTDSVATPEGGEAIVQTAIDAFGRVDIVINNAGILRDKAFHNMTPDLVDPVLDVHLRGAFNVTRPAWVKMREQSYGRVVNTASTAGSSATSVRPTTARPRWAWSASPGCSPRRAPATTSRPTPSPRSPGPA